ncbi:hypothetical protein GCM10022224_019260 [Nonomuraea antimicrobica]|uniref:Uncharacterized protein n=1 Tax=Nonomuraea antimicrobica TaxID=561173 RepID=A0ABP7BE33_9ACTN
MTRTREPKFSCQQDCETEVLSARSRSAPYDPPAAARGGSALPAPYWRLGHSHSLLLLRRRTRMAVPAADTLTRHAFVQAWGMPAIGSLDCYVSDTSKNAA